MDILRTKTNKTLFREMEKTRDSAIALIYCSNVCPFKFNRFFMCLYCPSRYRNMPELVQHVEIQHKHATEDDIRKSIVRLGRCQPIKINVLDYACKFCNDDICNYEDLKNHLIGKHKKRVNLDNDGVLPYKITEDEFICVLCEKKMEHYQLLNRHINEHYTNFICDQCGARFASDIRLKAHVSSHEVGAYPCEECGKVFTKVAYKQLHLQTVHLKAKRNKCTICDETFRDYYKKQKHLLTAHGVKLKEYKCNFCPRSFITSSNLRNHERRNHIKSQTYTCDVCDYTSFCKDFLTRHLICHTNEKNFKCQVCKKTYARKNTLKEHMRIHNNDRRFPCQYCDRAFIQKCSLKGHMKTHHNEFSVLQC